MSKLPDLKKEQAVTSFFLLGAHLHTHDLLAPRLAALPTIEEMASLFERLDNRLGLDSNFSLSKDQQVSSFGLKPWFSSLLTSMLGQHPSLGYDKGL
jgi:hypothetical protein